MQSRTLNCSYNSPEKDKITCFLEDSEGIQKKADNVSFIYIEPGLNHRSFMYQYPLNDHKIKIPVMSYDFLSLKECRIMGTEKSTTIVCREK